MERTIVYLCGYHESDPCSGDVVAAACEIKCLRDRGFIVCELFKELGIDKPDEVEIGKILHHLKVISIPIVAIITAQPELFSVGTSISKHTSSLHIFRQHLNYVELARITKNIGIDPIHVFSRLPYMEMLTVYNDALKNADYIVSTGEREPNSQDVDLFNHFVSFPPLCIEMYSVKRNSTYVNSGQISIAISGRFNDPLKGVERIIETLLALNREDNTADLTLNAFGYMPPILITRFKRILGDGFVYKGWISERNEYFSEISKNDIFISLPYYESYGMAFHEAIMLGLVPISTKCGIALGLSNMLGAESQYASCFLDNDIDLSKFSLKAAASLMYLVKNIELMKNHLHMLQESVSNITEDSWNISDIVNKLAI